MVDVPRVPLTRGSNDPGNSKDRVEPDSQKFKDLMKVDKTDPDQQKRQKSREQASKEAEANQVTAAAAAKEKPAESIQKFDKTPKIQKVGESEKKQPQAQKRPEEVVPEISKTEQKRRIKIQQAQQAEKSHTPPTKSTPSPDTEIEIVQEEEKKEEVVEDAGTFVAKQQEEVRKEAATPAPFQVPASETLGPLFIPAASSVPAAYSLLSAQAMALFERMVGVISVMTASGITETTIHLNTPEFQNSIFANCTIVIKEYDTAQKAFNIEFQGTAQNVALFNESISGLMAAFEGGRYSFKINRIEGVLRAEERPLFKRKESPSQKKEKDDTGGELK